MGFAILFVGLLMVITGARGTYAQFGTQIASEFRGPNNFAYWFIAIGSIGALGYIQSLQTISRYLMALILLSLFLSHRGFFAQFNAALKTGPVAPNALPSGGGTVAAVQSGAITPEQGIAQHQSGAFGQTPDSQGQAKFNAWINYFLGTK